MGILNTVLGIGGLLADVGSTAANVRAQREANRTNIKLQREQQSWEKDMSNTAVQRRAADIEAAGGNRALAFVTGSEASTPTVTPAQVQAPDYGSNWTAKQMALEQIRSIRIQNLKTAADTRLTDAQGKIAQFEANNLEKYGADERDWRYQAAWQDLQAKINANKISVANRQKIEQEIAESKQRILREIQETTNTGLRNKQLADTVDNLIAMARQQAQKGQLELDVLVDTAKKGGLSSPNQVKGVIGTIVNIWRFFTAENPQD